MEPQELTGDGPAEGGHTERMAPPQEQAQDKLSGNGRGDDAASRLIDLLRSFTIEIDRFIEAFSSAHGLHRTDLNAVQHIWDANSEDRPLTAGELSRLLSLSPAATTALIGRLERAGHVLREHDTLDRRRVHLRMQPPAQELAMAFFIPLGARMREAMAAYNEKEIVFVATFIERMLAATTAAADAAKSC
jgi:DNA-binding MarR family transcriptional regulator